MYEAFFGLKDKPFSPTPDPRYLYLSPNHREALAHLIYGIQERCGVIVITGAVGTGKTTLLHTMLTQPEQHLNIAFVWYPKLSFDDLLLYVLDTFGLPTTAASTAQRLLLLQQWLMEQHAKGQRNVLVIDEAHDLSVSSLEDIRLLSNLETAGEKLLHIVLVGQPELHQQLRTPHLLPLQQRIGMAYTIRPLSGAETQAYIAHRCAVAGGDARTLFTRRALKAMARRSGGIPRVINAVAGQALLTAYAAERRCITWRMVRQVRRDLQAWQPPLRWQRLARRVAVVMASLIVLSIVLHAGRVGRQVVAALSQLHAVLWPVQPAETERIAGRGAPLAEPETHYLALPSLPTHSAPLPQEAGREVSPAPESSRPITRTMKAGDSVAKHAREIYGFSTPAVMEQIKKYNPHIKNMARIQIGDVLIFPAFAPSMEPRSSRGLSQNGANTR